MAVNNMRDTPHGDGVAAQAQELVKVYGSGQAAIRAVDGVSVSVPAGSFTAMMGPSGSGKSTLLHCLAGLDRPTHGSISIGGTDLAALNDKRLTRLRRDRVGFVFQGFNLVPTLTAEENILLPLRLGRRKPEPGWFDTLVSSLGLGGRLDHRPAELSDGQQQRVAVARALVTRPEVVFADEPTGNLDQANTGELLQLLRWSVDELGQTILMVTHDAAAAAVADRVWFLADGRPVDRLGAPTFESILDHLKGLEV